MSDPRDGSHICQSCRTALNVDDRSCWRCGGTNIVATAVQPTTDLPEWVTKPVPEQVKKDWVEMLSMPFGHAPNFIPPVGQPTVAPASRGKQAAQAPESEIQMYRGYLLEWDGSAWQAYKIKYEVNTHVVTKTEALLMAQRFIDQRIK